MTVEEQNQILDEIADRSELTVEQRIELAAATGIPSAGSIMHEILLGDARPHDVDEDNEDE